MHRIRSVLGAALVAASALGAGVTPARAAAPAPDPTPPLSTLSGTVTDPAGAPLAGVRVTVLEVGRTAETDADGHYAVPDLPRGTYGIAFARIGYRPEVRRLAVRQETVTLDVVMRASLVELPEVQVTATPLATTSLTSPQPTNVVGGAELDLHQAASLGETLEHVAGVRNYSTGSGIGKPVIRGLTGNRVLVLADGQRTETQQWGDEHGPNVETSTAERIEVIRGPASVLYGSDAIGGVINVVEPELPDAAGRTPFVRGRLSAAYGTNGRAPDGTLTLEGARGPLGIRGSLFGRRAGDVETPGGTLANSGLESYGGSGAVGLRGGWGSGQLEYGYRDERLEIHEDPTEEPDATPYQRVATHRARVTTSFPIRLARLQLDAGYESNRRREFEEAGATELALGLLSETVTADAHFHHAPLGPLDGILGASFLRTDVDIAGEETLVPPTTTLAVAAYLYEQVELGPWHLSLGARVDHRTLDVEATPALDVAAQSRDWNSFTGNVGVLYRVSDPVALVLNVGRGFRAPSAFDLFARGEHEGTGRFERGDPTLGVEKSLNTDLAVRVQTDRLHAEVGGFVNLIDDYIFPDPTGATDEESGLPVYDIVQGDARLVGLEASAELHATSWLHFRSVVDYTRGTNTTLGQPLPFVPPLRVGYSVRLEHPGRGPLRDLYFELGGETNARQTRADPEDVAPDGYTLVDASAGFATTLAGTDVAIDLSVRNALDTSYRAFLSRYKRYADDPGRNVVLRVTTAF